jgi:hypothetical protein
MQLAFYTYVAIFVKITAHLAAVDASNEERAFKILNYSLYAPQISLSYIAYFSRTHFLKYKDNL